MGKMSKVKAVDRKRKALKKLPRRHQMKGQKFGSRAGKILSALDRAARTTKLWGKGVRQSESCERKKKSRF